MGVLAMTIQDDETRAFSRWATEVLRATCERDVCSHCMRELLIIPNPFGWQAASLRPWSNTLVYESERYTNGVHGCYPVSRLATEYLFDFWYNVLSAGNEALITVE